MGERRHADLNIFPGNYIEDLDRFVPDILSKMKWSPGETILDYGCGFGIVTYHYLFLPKVAPNESKLFGVDISEKWIEDGKKRYPDERITFQAGDIHGHFPFKNIQFDKIFSIYCLEFVPDLRSAMVDFAKMLKPGGYIGIAMHDGFMFNMIREIGEREKWKQYEKKYEKDVNLFPFTPRGKAELQLYRDLLEKAGLKVIMLEAKEQQVEWEVDWVINMMANAIPLKASVPEERHQELMEDVREEFTRILGIPKDSKKALCTYQCVGAVAQKPE